MVEILQMSYVKKIYIIFSISKIQKCDTCQNEVEFCHKPIGDDIKCPPPHFYITYTGPRAPSNKKSFHGRVASIKKLFDGTQVIMVPSRNKLFDRTLGCKVPSNNKLFDGTVPSIKQLFDGTVPSNSFSLKRMLKGA